MMDTDDFRARLSKIMSYYGLSASAFAELIQVQKSSISHVLSGRNKPSLDFILKLNAAFPDLSLYWLLNGVGEMISITPTPISSAPTTKTNIQHTETKNDPEADSSKAIERIVIFYKDGTFGSYGDKLLK